MALTSNVHWLPKKAFDRVWKDGLYNAIKRYNIGNKLPNIISAVYKDTSKAVVTHEGVAEWFLTIVGVRQGCLLSPVLFNIFLKRILQECLTDRSTSEKIEWGQIVSNPRVAVDIALLAGSHGELQEYNATRFGTEISTEKTKTMTITNQEESPIYMNGKPLAEVETFTFLGANSNRDDEYLTEISSKIAEIYMQRWKGMQGCGQVKTYRWRAKSNCEELRALVMSDLLRGCESRSVTADIERRISAVEMKKKKKKKKWSTTEGCSESLTKTMWETKQSERR